VAKDSSNSEYGMDNMSSILIKFDKSKRWCSFTAHPLLPRLKDWRIYIEKYIIETGVIYSNHSHQFYDVISKRWIIWKYNMSKCEHGDKITIFCATDSCAWKEAAGCPLCIKRYHNHIGPTIFLNEEDITVIVKKYNVEQSIKPKCRLLQEAIFNYLNLFKTELTNSIDAVCKNIINQIGYPYLSNTNTLPAYKRLKNK